MRLIDGNIKNETASGGPGTIFRASALFPLLTRLILKRLFNRHLYKRAKTGKAKYGLINRIFPKLRPGDILRIATLIIFVLYPAETIAVPPNTVIQNTAEGTYKLGILEDIQLQSNTVTVITVVRRTSSSMDLLRYAPSNPSAELVSLSTTYYSSSGTPNGQFIAMPPPIAIGQTDPIDLNSPVPLIRSNRLAVGEPAFIRLTDPDQNIDSSSTESVLAHFIINENNESELLRLIETAPNSGIFTGYIQTGDQFSAQANNGFLAAAEGYKLEADYTDLFDSQDSSSDSMQFILSDRSIYIVKSASKNVVARGDYLQYKLNIVNVTTVLFEDVSIIDRLPFSTRYREGSATINGNHIQDPVISSDAHTLTFDAGDMIPDQAINLRYITEVGANADPGPITNEAYAVDNFGTLSNIARASVQVEEELFRNNSFIMGQVLSGDCDSVPEPDTVFGVEGARIYLEDGTYAVTDHNGMYHFEGVEPGVHVLQLDFGGLSDKYELLSCDQNSRFAGNPASIFIDLQGGTTWRVDFHVKLKPKRRGNIVLHLTSDLQDTIVSYELLLQVNSVSIRDSRVMIMLPAQISYLAGSSRLDESAIDDPEISGNVLTYRLGEIPEGTSKFLNFSTSLNKGNEEGYLATSCIMVYDTPENTNQQTEKITNEIYLRPETRRIQLPQIILHPKFKSFSANLDSTELIYLNKAVEKLKGARVTEIYVTGHSDNVPINPRSRYICGDNYELSLARANSVASYLSKSLEVNRSHFVVEGKGPDEPIADNSTSEGRALNRRVELTIYAEQVLNKVIPEMERHGDSTYSQTIGLRPGEKWEYPVTDYSKKISIDKYNQAWLDAAEPGFEWLWPSADYNPPIPSLKIAIKHQAGNSPKLYLDGKEVPQLNFTDMLVSESGDKAVSLWSGIDIHQGFNNFSAVIYDNDGNEIDRLESTVHYTGQPVYVEIIDSLSNLTADNSVQPTIAARFTDKDGYPVRSGVIGEWSVDPPYAPQQQLEQLQVNPLLNLKGSRPSYLIGENGIALLRLQATSQTGEAVLRFYFMNHEEERRVWLKPRLRDWVVVGLAEGTIGYNTTKGNVESSKSAGIDDNFHSNGKTAFFASGSVKNKWLLTIAGDTKKIGGNSRDNLMQTINPRKFYPLYGDAVQQGYSASSTQGVFVKVEQDRGYALYGDYNTGLNFTELSRYNRTFTGFKSELKTGKHNFNVYASETNLAFVKDEILGDGTSGLYYLSRKNIAVNSEKITIEIRNRFRNEEIISTEVMKRYLDYNIDYYEGSIYFKRPIPSRDEQFNPVFIVAVYESNDNSDRSYNYGGRGGIGILNNKLDLGGTYIHEGRVGGRGDLGGIDATCRITKGTELKSEFALSGLKIGAGSSSGFAYLTEVKHHTGNFSGRIYIRSLEPDFGLGQQNQAQIGTRRIGADLVRKFSDKFQVGTEFYRLYNLLTDSKRNYGETRFNYTAKRFTGRAGFRYAEDHLGNGEINKSNQLNAGVGYKFFNGKFAVRLDREQSIGNNDNPDFPTRTILGADYNFSRYITIYGEQEFARGESEKAEGTRIGVKAKPWAGAQINSSIQRHYNENGERVFSNLGLIQTWRINEKLSVDFGLDNGRLVRGPDNFRFNPNEPPTSGNPDGFTALSVGSSYKEKSWSTSSRIEYRNAKSEDRYGITANIFGEPRPGLGVMSSVRYYNSRAAGGIKKDNGDIQFSLVYRPSQTAWMVFNRLNFKFDKQSGGEFDSDNWRLVDNLSSNHKLNRRTGISLQYGAKYLRENIDGLRFSDYMDLVGVESRYDITTKWDIGARVSLLHSWNLKQYDYSTGISTGYNLFKNAWLSAGYNFTGFEDKDFSGGSYSARGPYLQFRLKVDYQSAKSVIGFFRSTGDDVRYY